MSTLIELLNELDLFDEKNLNNIIDDFIYKPIPEGMMIEKLTDSRKREHPFFNTLALYLTHRFYYAYKPIGQKGQKSTFLYFFYSVNR